VPFVVDALPLAGDTEGLTRVAANDAIHDATPGSAVEGSEIAPKRRVIQRSLFHARNQLRGCVGFVFNVADCASICARQVDAEIESAGSGAEAKDVEGT
jgi:hypothetical protein